MATRYSKQMIENVDIFISPINEIKSYIKKEVK